MQQPNWKDWKSTLVGILTLLLPLVGMFWPKFTAENQQVVLGGVNSLIEMGTAIVGIVGGLILVFKTSFSK